jgi:transcription termination/antitermination protein NusA
LGSAAEREKEVSAELVQALKELEREKGISFETILRGLEEALASAYKSAMKIEESEDEDEQPREDVRVTLDPESGDMRAFHLYLDVEGNVTEEKEVELTADFKGRIAAQTAKQVILQKLRDAEREITYEEFAGREGDVVTGIVQQTSAKATFLDLGKVEALLPFQEKVPAESYRQGERLKVFITEVRRTGKGPQIIVSRTHPELLKALFALEVPEIAEGIVEIKGVAREPGHRSKIAVASNEPGVDPVGACVGAKGSRVRMVVNELRGEKIDVVEWSDDSARFVGKALAPASVKDVKIDQETQTALVTVPDYQLSLAIGKEGQNARLAARLTGWRIDIKSESQVAEEHAASRAPKPTVAPPAEEAPPTDSADQEAASEEGTPAEAEEAGTADQGAESEEGEPVEAEGASDGAKPTSPGESEQEEPERGAAPQDAPEATTADEPTPETVAAASDGEGEAREEP